MYCLVPAGSEHDGAFARVRKFDVHTGVDLYCNPGQEVTAVEDGVVVGIEIFTGPNAESPWWHETRAVLVEGDSGVVLYGELQEYGNITVGTKLRTGDAIGQVVQVRREARGKPMTMLHFELYDHGVTKSVWWQHGEPKPPALQDPTEKLIEAHLTVKK